MAFITRHIGQRLLRLSLLVLVAMMALATPATHAAPAAQGVADSPAIQALLARAQANGAVRIIVHLNAPFSPENERGAPEAVRSQLPIPEAARRQREGIQRAQDTVLQRLAGHKFGAVTRFEFVPGLALTVDAPTLAALAADPDVSSIQEDQENAPDLDVSVPHIGGSPIGTFGTGDYSGKGKTIAILDTGVMKTHKFLSGKVVAEACYSITDTSLGYTSFCPDGSTASTAPGSGVNCTIAGCDHGTHVAGIAAGHSFSGSNTVAYNGVAKDASLIAIQVFHKTTVMSECQSGPNPTNPPCIRASNSDILSGLEQVYRLVGSVPDIAAVNLSLGGGMYTSACDSTFPDLTHIIETLRGIGIATVVASGNNSYVSAVSAPACISSAITVGRTDITSGGADAVAATSNMSALVDLLAPGSSINSSVTSTDTAMGSKSGTSMAAPHVAGAWAVMEQKLGLPGVSTVLAALQNTGLQVTDTRSGGTQTKPRIRVNAAADSVGVICPDAFDQWSDDPSFDDDDSLKFADDVTVDAPAQTHYFCSTLDEDWIKLSASPGVTYQVEASSLSSNNDTQLQVYHGTTLIALNDDADDGTYGSKVIFTPWLSGGNYYARVRPAVQGMGGSTAFAYNLQVRKLGQPCSDADDNTAAKALPFTINTTQSGGLCDSADQDWVKVQITKPNTTLRIETLNLGLGQSPSGAWAGTNTALALYDNPNLAPLKTNDDINVVSGVWRLRSVIEYTFANVGMYYVKVKPAGAGGLGQTYDLRISRIDKLSSTATATLAAEAVAPALKLDDPPPPAPKGVVPAAAGIQPTATLSSTAITLDTVCADPGELGDGNNSPPTADPISVSTAQYFCSPADEDWFKFDVSQNVTYKLDTYLVSANNDPLLEVYSDQGETLVRSNDDNDDDGAFGSGGYRAGVSFTAASTGTYYARVRPSPAASNVGGDASFGYNLRLMSRTNLCAVNEPDNDAFNGQAKDFVVGTLQSRALCGSGDQDWVRIKITKPDTTMRIETLNMGTAKDANGIWRGTDTVLELYGSLSAPKLTDNDDWNAPARRSLIEYTFANAGTYFVKVFPFANFSVPGQTYDLRITRIDKVLLGTP